MIVKYESGETNIPYFENWKVKDEKITSKSPLSKHTFKSFVDISPVIYPHADINSTIALCDGFNVSIHFFATFINTLHQLTRP